MTTRDLLLAAVQKTVNAENSLSQDYRLAVLNMPLVLVSGTLKTILFF